MHVPIYHRSLVNEPEEDLAHVKPPINVNLCDVHAICNLRFKKVGVLNFDSCHQTSCLALTGVAQWIECRPSNQRVTGSIPTQGTCLGCGPGPQ